MRQGQGQLLENLVLVALRRNHSELYYFKERGDREVDLVVPAWRFLLDQPG